MSRSIYCLSLLGLFAIAGCSSNSTTPPETNQTFTSFTFTNFNFFSGDTSVTRQTVLPTTTSIGGKTDVTMIRDSTLGEFDTLYVKYEANGDVSLYTGRAVDVQMAATWLTLPVASGKANAYLRDTTYDEAGTTTHEFLQDSALLSAPDGSLPFSVPPGGTWYAISHNDSTVNDVTTGNLHSTSYFYYMPSIHYFAYTGPAIREALFGKSYDFVAYSLLTDHH